MIHDHDILNVAVNLKHEGLIAAYEAMGMSNEKAHKKAMRFGKRIQSFWDDLYADLEDDGIPTSVYPVNPANLE